MKTKFSDYTDLFTLLLDSYEYLENNAFSADYDFHMFNDFILYVKNNRNSVSFMDLAVNFLKPSYNEINRNRIVSFIKAIDDLIYCFEEYHDLFKNTTSVALHHNNNFYVLIRPKNSLTKTIDINKNLRKERFAKQNTIVEKLRLKKLCFFLIDNDFNYSIRYVEMKSLEDKINSGDLSIKYLHMVNCVEYGKIIKTEPYDEIKVITNSEYFSIEYKNKKEYTNWYLRSLNEALVKEDNDVIIIPEITTSNIVLSNIQNFIKDKNVDKDILIVCGSNWHNKASVINVFNSHGDLLVQHNKFIPFEEEVDSHNTKMSVSENIDTPKPYTINLLHIKNVGLFGFMICSDLLSDDFILAYVKARITNLIMCSFSYSSDIFYDLTNLAAKYNIVSSACNVCFPSHDGDGYLFLPNKANTARRYLCIKSQKCSQENCIKCQNYGCCGSNIKTEQYINIDQDVH